MIPTLQSICQAEIIKVLEHREFDGRLVNDLCKYVPDFLLEPIFTVLSQKGVVTDTALLAFLVPSRISLFIHQARSIRNSTFKQIGLNCPNLVTLDLSNCSQVGNSVVRAILQGCPLLESMFLDRCHRITDSAFDVSESPFQFLLGCLSLQAISLQGCPQITGEIITTLNKNCRRLNYLNLSQCKNVKSPKIQHIFEHNELLSLNLGYIENISDEAFLLLPSLLSPGTGMHTSSRNSSTSGITTTSPLQKLNLCKSTITDRSIFKMSSLIALLEIRLQWCTGITDRGITALVQYCPLLQLIDLKSCNISDNGLQSIAEQCYELRELDLSWCINFTEMGLLQLIPLFHSDKDNKTHNLSNLNLEWCMQITDQSLYQLNQIKTLKNIKLTGCVGVSKVGIDWLKNTGRNVSS